MKKTNSGFGLIEILIVVAIIAFIIVKLTNAYYKKPLVNKETQKVLSEQGINTTNYGAMKDSVKKTLKNINASREEDIAATE